MTPLKVYQKAAKTYKSLKRRLTHFKNLFFDHSPKILLLAYHRILPNAHYNPLRTIVSSKIFIEQIDWLSKRFPIISLSSAVEQALRKKAKKDLQIILTFDDGYQDNYEIVFPLLRNKGIPAAFFLVANYINKNAPLWDWELISLLQNAVSFKSIEIENQILSQKSKEPRSLFIFRILEKLKSTNPDITKMTLTSIKQKIDHNFLPKCIEDKCMTWEQVIKMSNTGMEIGAHSLSHRSLAKITPLEAVAEIEQSKIIIENHIKKPCLHFAFPFGSRNDYNKNLIQCVKNAGYQSCLLNIHGYNRVEKGLSCFKRIIMHETLDLKYLLG